MSLSVDLAGVALGRVAFAVRQLFTLGQDIGGAHWFTDPNTLYRRRNLLTYTGGSYASPWAVDNSGATNPTVTANYAAAPDGTMTAARVQLNKTGGVFSRLRCVVSYPTGRQYVVSVYARTTSGSGTANVGLRGADAGGANMAVSGTWQRFTYALGTITTPADFQILLWDNIAGNDETADILIWGAQLELGSTPTEYQDVPTTWPEAYLAAVGAENIFAWTDNAGTTPVTAVGDTIGLSLDRAYGGRTDGSLIASGATGLTGTATAASYNTGTGAGSVSRAGDASNQSWVTWTGLTTSAIHRIRVTNTGATSLDVRNGSVSGTIVASIAAGATSYVHPLTSGGSTSITITATNNSTTATFTVLEFGRVPGTHLIQATGTARPTLSARVNALLASETLGSTVWDNATPNLATVSGTLVTAATGGTGSTRRQVLTLIGGTALKTLFRLSAGTATQSRLIVRDNTNATQAQAFLDWSGGVPSLNGASNGTWTITLVGSQYWVVNTFTLGSGASIVTLVSLYPDSAAGTGNVNCHGIDLRTADDASKSIPAYQRVGATAADHDTDGFPHYALFDGTDDSWASAATVDGSGSDKVTVVAGVTKNSDAASGCVIELTANSGSTAQSFAMFGPDTGGVGAWFWRSRGSSAAVSVQVTGYAAPKSSVVTGIGDISGDVTQIRVDGVVAGSSTTDQGTGNYANDTLYVGSRGGSSIRLNGRIYSLVGRFGAMSDTDRNRLEQWTKTLMRLP